MILDRRLLLGLCFALAACAPAGRDEDGAVTVFAAASLQDVLSAAAEAYRAAGHGEVVFSFAGTSALARQLEQGAPADLFISADVDWMDYVEDRNLIAPETRVDLLGNRLVLAAPASSALCFPVERGMPLASELRGGRLALAAPEVPAGRYAEAALQALGVWEEVKDHTARGENVRAALQYVARGEAPYGVVYQTDALIDPGVRVVGLFPEDSHPPIVYPAAVVVGGREGRAADFLAWLRGPQAELILHEYGFSRPGP